MEGKASCRIHPGMLFELARQLVEFLELGWRQGQLQRTSVLHGLLDAAGAWNHDHQVLVELVKPGQSDLPGGCAVRRRDLAELLDEGPAALEALGAEATHPLARTGSRSDIFRMLVVLAGEQPLLQRGVGDDGDAQFLRRRQSAVRLHAPIEQAVFHLVRRQRKAMLRQRRVRTTHARQR